MRCLSCLREGLPHDLKTCPECGASLALMLRDSLPHGTLLRSQTYSLDYPLGKGSFGITYLAHHASLDEPVAIKEYYPNNFVLRDGDRLQVPVDYQEDYQRGLLRFIEEGRFLAKLNHPHIVKVRDLFEERGTAYLVMELIEGLPLSLALNQQRDRQFPPQRVEKFVEQLVQALSVIHEAGICHLDLKPDNILLTGDEKLTLVDFGAAKPAHQTHALSTRSYTESYAAPEIMAGGELGAESDLFELGMMIHELLTGELPPTAMSRLLNPNAWQVSGFAPPWQDLLESALVLKRSDRPASVKTWWETRQQISRKLNRQSHKFAEKLRGHFTLPSLEQEGWQRQLGLGTIRRGIPLSAELIVAITAGGASLLQMPQGNVLWQINCPTERGAISGDGRWLALVWQTTIQLWDLKTGQWARSLEGHQKTITDLAFSLDGQYLVSGSKDETLRLWDIDTGRTLHCLSEIMGAVTAVAIAPDGLTLASGCREGTIRLWQRSSGEAIHHLRGHQDAVTALTFSADGRRLGSGSRDCAIQIWEVETGQAHQLLIGHHDWITALSFSPDNQLLASAAAINDKEIRLWYLPEGQEIQQLSGHWNTITTLAFTPDSRSLLSGGYDYSLRIWDMTQSSASLDLTLFQQWIYAVAFSPDNRTFATGHNNHAIALWDILQPQPQRYLKGHQDAISCLAFSPNGQLLASGSWDSTLRLWDLSTGKMIRTFQDHADWVQAVAFSPNGQWLASGGWDRTVRIWDVSSQGWNLYSKPFKILQGHLDHIEALAFSPDSHWLATGSDDRTVSIWEVESGLKLHRLEGHRGNVEQIAFSDDGQFILSGCRDRTLYLWHVLSGKLMHRFVGHQDAVTCVQFHPNGHWFASGSRDGRLRIWDVLTGEAIATLNGHTGSIHDLAISSDGRHLVSVDHHGVIQLWQFDPA